MPQSFAVLWLSMHVHLEPVIKTDFTVLSKFLTITFFSLLPNKHLLQLNIIATEKIITFSPHSFSNIIVGFPFTSKKVR